MPSPGGVPNPNDVSDIVDWWESPDIKVDVSPYYSPDALFDGVEFDEDLQHEDAKRTETNRFYLQVHNRGWQPTSNVRVRAFFADASAGLPSLPNALTPPDFNLSSTADWQPVGPAQTIATLEPNRPVIVSWDWTVPPSAATHSCLLAVISSPDDPITTVQTNVDVLIASEKRVCLKNLHVVNSSGPRPSPVLLPIKFHNARAVTETIDIIVNPTEFAEGAIGLLLEPVSFADPSVALQGVQPYPLRAGEDIGSWYVRPGDRFEAVRSEILDRLDHSLVFEFDPAKASEIRGIRIASKQTIHGVITCRGHHKVPYGRTQKFAIMQRQDGRIVGGSTYEVRLPRAKGLHPVSRIRVVLDTIEILNDREPWFKGRGEFVFLATLGFNHEAGRTHRVRLPEDGVFKLGDKPGRNRISPKQTIFEGYIAEKDNMTVTIAAIEKDTFDPDDALTLYQRTFSYPPETWVGTYGPDNDRPDLESMHDWKVAYRIESLKL